MPQITAQVVRDRVVRLIPAAKLGLAPHGASLVNIETLMWVDAQHRQTLPAVQILGHDVHITLTLDKVRWRFGDRHAESTDSPGKRYDEQGDPCTTRQCPDYFGHVYRRPGHVQVRATATWTARFTVDGGNAQTIPGTVAGPTSTAALVIKQARGVLVPNPGQH